VDGQLTLIIGIYVCGLVAMVVEMFIPGAVIGTIGFLAVLGSVIYALATGHQVTALVLIGCTLALLPVFFMLWKNVVGRLFAMKGEERDFSPSTTVNEELVGVEGVAVTHLRPTGIARLDERRYDVVSRGELIEKGTPIKVVEVSGNRVVVTSL
jgi:membrane-bound serine protease (ClpP class)